MLDTQTKECRVCIRTLPKSDFYFNKTHNCHAYRCKKCDNKARAQRDSKDRPSANARWHKWHEANREKERHRLRMHYASHKARYAANVRRRQATQLNATPSWAEVEKMKVVYQKAKEFDMHVDHVVPLKHKLVCGLHVWANLQLLAAAENLSKQNRFWPDSPMEHN